MTQYGIEVTCKQCGQSWQKQVEVEEMNAQPEAVRFLGEIAKNHQSHGQYVEWYLTCRPAE